MNEVFLGKKLYNIFFFLSCICCSSMVFGQGENLQNYYKQHLHFGFSLGVNSASFIIKPVRNIERFDSLKVLDSPRSTGFNLGIVSELRLSDHWTFRFLPNLVFAQKNLNYYYESKTDTFSLLKKVESSIVEFPVALKLTTNRYQNFAAYMLFGGKYALDLASKKNAKNTGIPETEIVKIKKGDLCYEIGAGADFFLTYFKFAIEARISIGTRDLLIRDNTMFSNPIERLNARMFMISLLFEG